MKVTIYENRTLDIRNAYGTQNENEATEMQFVFPNKYRDYSKKINFFTPSGTLWDIIENDRYSIGRDITENEQVEFYIQMISGDIDVRTESKELNFNPNEEATGQPTPAETNGFNAMLEELDERIDEVENIDISSSKTGNIATIIITRKDGTTQTINLEDGQDYLLTQSDKEDIKNLVLNDEEIQEVVSDSHTHTNKTVLDDTTASYTVEEKSKLEWLENYDDSEIREEIEEKVDKVDGKGLSTNDYTTTEKSNVANNTSARHTHSNKDTLDNIEEAYTTTEKNKLASLHNYDDSEIQSALENKVDKITGKSLVDDTEIARLANVDNYDDTEIQADISNLETNKANTSDIPSKTSDLTNDSGFIDKDVSDLTNYIKKTDYATNTSGGIAKVSYDLYGVKMGNTNNQFLQVAKATTIDIDGKSDAYKPIVPFNLDYAVRSVRPVVKTTLDNPAQVNTIYDLGEQTNLAVNLPTGQLGDFIQVDFLSTNTPTVLTLTASSSALSDVDLTPETNKIYSLFFVYGRLETAVYGWKVAYSENTRTVV